MKRTILTAVLALGAGALLPVRLGAGPLQGRLAELEPLLGTWEVEATWSHGMSLWSRAQYAAGANGNTVEGRVLVKDGDGPPYQRYLTVYSFDAAREAWVVTSVRRDGSVTSTDVALHDGVLTTEWTEGDTVYRDRSDFSSGKRMQWTVSMTPVGGGETQMIMDAVWHKYGEDFMPRPIDSNLFVADETTTSFVTEATIRAPVDAVYRAWTDGAAFAAAYGPDRKELRADIDLAIGGRYEWLWDGKMGSNDCQVLSFIPNRMVSFSWNAPPDQADSRAQRTWVVVELEPVEGGTHVRLTHLGFGAAPHWQETKAYFEKAWPYVLEQFRKNLEGRGG